MSAPTLMTSVPGYALGETLVESDDSLLLRGRRTADGSGVLIKLLRRENPSPREVAILRREFEVGRSLPAEGVLRPNEILRAGSRLALVLEDFAGQPLRRMLDGRPLEIATVLRIGVESARALAHVHQRDVIHKKLSPASLFIAHDLCAARITDFSICTRLSREETRHEATVALEGELRYVSPEQTGRMNRAVDLRSDLYSLGITLYELLTGRVPFEAEDPLELVHCHIARIPAAPIELEPRIPGTLSSIVMKLLAKRAEDRYQSAAGLRADLEACLESWKATGRIESLELGRCDVVGRLEIPEELYGRETETAALMAAFERACTGRVELFLVSGYSGVGKSALVHELHEPIVRRRGTFVFGKFDQLRRDAPYSALIQALGQVVQQILTGSEERVAAWRDRLQGVLGDNGRILVELIPGLELIVGPQPPVQPLPPTEAQIRFNLLLHAFVLSLAAAEHPLALFLDDLQWADSATLGLLQRLATDPGARHLLLIGAYRDNEVDLHHPLVLALAELRKVGASVVDHSLQPLGLAQLEHLISDALVAERDRVRPLASLVLEKTGGNPFHVTQFLRSLHEQGLLRLDEAARAWTFDVERIAGAEMTTNVVELMVAKIRRLPPQTQEVLRLAGCIGNRFDLETLALVSETSQEEAGWRIWGAVREGLVLPYGSSYKLLAEPHHRPEERPLEPSQLAIAYRFLHDRVQQAAYALIHDEERDGIHLRIGRLLRDGSTPEAREERLFDIANHLNAGSKRILDPAERLELARLNLSAGRKAIQSSAYEPAATFLAAGIGALPAEAWERHYELALALHTAAAEAEYMRLAVGRAQELSEIVLRKARRPLEKIGVYELRIQHEIAEARLTDALGTALEALELLGLRFPRRPTTLHVLVEFLKTRMRLARRSIEDMRRLPEMTDPEKLAAMRLLLRVSPAAYQSSPELLALIICKEMDLILRHGTSYHAAQAYCSWAVLLCFIAGDVRGTYEYGCLGVEVAHQCPHKDVQSRSIFYFTAFHQHWAEPQKDSDELLTRYQAGCIEGGDLQFYGYSVYFPMYLSFFAGREIEPLVERFERGRASLSRLGLENMLHMTNVGLQAVLALTGKAEVRDRLAGDRFDSEELVPRLMAIHNHSACFFAHMMDMLLAYLFGQHERAIRHATECVKLLDAIMSTVFVVQTRLYQALAHAAHARELEGVARRRALRVVRKNLAMLHKWSLVNPGNFQHKRDLVEAEWRSLAGQHDRAEAAYERAAAGAREHGFTHEEALARERAALHFLGRGRPTIAAAYMREAAAAYAAWGATAKVEQLRSAHHDLFRADEAGTRGSAARGHEGISIDLESVLRASRVISSEIVLDRLLASLLRIVVQNAGAERGVLVRIGSEGAVVVAEGTGDHVDLVRSEPLEASRRVPTTVVQLAIRTGEAIVLQDASQAAPFDSDPYVRERGSRSVLAVPTHAQGKVTGVVYVENDLTPGAFTPERVEVLRMLASQAAVSFENAELYTGMARLNRAYERFVPRAFLRQLARKSIVDVELGDSVERELSILFADLRSFSTITERMTPAESFRFINSFLGRMEPVVERHGGFIDKYLGDAIIALFERTADDTVRAAVDMQTELRSLNAERAAAGEEPIRMGIGIATGRAMLGTVGGPNRMDGTVIGDTVNLAERLEKLTKLLGADVLLSGETVARLAQRERYAMRWLGHVQVKGKQELVEVHELLEGCDEALVRARMATRGELAEALRLRQAGDESAAEERLLELAAAHPSDGTLRVLLELTDPARSALAAPELNP